MEEIEIRITEKIEDIRKYMEELYSFFPESFEEYERSILIKAASERLFEKIIEAAISIVFFLIRRDKLGNPEDEESAFDILSRDSIIDSKLSKNLRKAKSMRNRIVHQYEKVDDIQVYTSISEELEEDMEEFIKQISKKLT